MGRKITVILVLLLISFLAIMVYFLQQGRKTLLTDPYKAVSPDACIVIETINLQNFLNSLTSGRGLFGELGKVRDLEVFEGKMKYFTGQLNKLSYKRLLNGSRAVISFYPEDNGKIQAMLSMTIPSEIKARHLKEMLRSSGIKNILDRKLIGNEVLGLPFVSGNNNDTAWISGFSGMLICSSSKNLMKIAILQTGRDKDVRDTPGFLKIYQASGKNADRIFVVFKNVSKIIRPLFRKESANTVGKIQRLADCAEGDMYVNENGIVMSGYAECTDTTDFFYKYKIGDPAVPSAWTERHFFGASVLVEGAAAFRSTTAPALSLPNPNTSSSVVEPVRAIMVPATVAVLCPGDSRVNKRG